MFLSNRIIFITGQPALFWVSSYMSLWSNILFNFAVLINIIVAFFYPFGGGTPGLLLFFFYILDLLSKFFNLV